MCALCACQSYERRPLDTGASVSEFVARTPGSTPVAEYAHGLEARERAAVGVSRSFDPSDGLEVWEAEVVALVFNNDLRRARARAGVALAVEGESGLWQDPELGVDLTRILESVSEPWKVFTTMGFTLPVSGRLELEKQRAGLAHAAEVARVWAEEWRVRMDVRRAWAEWTVARERADMMEEYRRGIDALVAIVDRIEQAGEMSRVEARLFRLEQSAARADAARLGVEAAGRELEIKRLLGLPPSAGLDLRPGGVAVMGEEGLRSAHERITDRAPSIIVARAEYEVAEKTLELEVRRQYPDVTIGPGYGREDGQDQFLLGISAPLPLLNANRLAIARARAEREERRVVFEGVLQDAMAELESAVQRLAGAETVRRELEDTLAPLADVQYEEVRRVAQMGEVDALVLLESLKAQREAKLRVLEARLSEQLASVRLDEVAGPAEAMGQTERQGGQR
ncbi:MAG: TolC family protein [Phycisphaerales bacterium]